MGNFLSSILYINKFISGKFDFSNCCLILKDLSKYNTISTQCNIKIDDQEDSNDNEPSFN